MTIHSPINLKGTFAPVAHVTAAEAIVMEFTSPNPAEKALLNL